MWGGQEPITGGSGAHYGGFRSPLKGGQESNIGGSGALLARSSDVIQLKTLGFKMRVDDVGRQTYMPSPASSGVLNSAYRVLRLSNPFRISYPTSRKGASRGALRGVTGRETD